MKTKYKEQIVRALRTEQEIKQEHKENVLSCADKINEIMSFYE